MKFRFFRVAAIQGSCAENHVSGCCHFAGGDQLFQRLDRLLGGLAFVASDQRDAIDGGLVVRRKLQRFGQQHQAVRKIGVVRFSTIAQAIGFVQVQGGKEVDQLGAGGGCIKAVGDRLDSFGEFVPACTVRWQVDLAILRPLDASASLAARNSAA